MFTLSRTAPATTTTAANRRTSRRGKSSSRTIVAAKRPSGEWGPRFERAWAEAREATRRANAMVGLGALGLWGVEDEGARAGEGEAQPRGVEIEIEIGPGKRWDAAAENAYVEPIPPPR